MKNQSRENSYKKQLIGVGILAGLLIFILGAFAVIRIVAAQSNRPSAPRGDDPASQLARKMERAFPPISILGVNENPQIKDVEVLFYDPDPPAEWSTKERDQMDEVMFLAMRFAADREMGLALYVISPSVAVGLDGEEVSVLFVNGVFYCYDILLQDIDWSIANHDTIKENCSLFPASYHLDSTEEVLWPVSQERSR